jgi:RNA polymerase sigma-70 factor (ECF subfamily)
LGIPAVIGGRQADIFRDFRQAWEAKDISALIGLLDPGVMAIADGGGVASAALFPIEGAEHVAHYAVDVVGQAPA